MVRKGSEAKIKTKSTYGVWKAQNAFVEVSIGFWKAKLLKSQVVK